MDVRVKRIDLPDEVSDSVYNRMRQDFARQASQLRAEGDEQAQRIRAEAEREIKHALRTLAGHHERVRAQAPTFRIPLAPRDPYDVLRGRYFILNPLDRDLNTSQGGAILTGATVETFLRGEKGFYGTALVGFCPAGSSVALTT